MALTQEQIKEFDRISGLDTVSVQKNRVSELKTLVKSTEIGGIETDTQSIKDGQTGVKGFATGFTKGILSTVKGAGELGTKIGQATAGKLVEAVTGKGFETADIFTEGTQANRLAGKILEAKTTAEKVGKTTEQIGEFAVPASKIAKLEKGIGLGTKIAGRGLTSGTVASVQEGEVGKEALAAGAVEAALPVAGKVIKPAFNIIGRVFKGLGSGLSGASSEAIENIVKNPSVAKETIKKINEEGSESLLRENAKKIVQGVSKIKSDARKAYGKGLEELAEADIKSSTFRAKVQPVLDKFGSTIENGERVLKNVEFENVKSIKKASDFIERLKTVDLNGKSIRKLVDDIDSSRFKTATSDERLSYNAFAKDLSSSLKKAINESTDKLSDINKNFSQEMQLAESVEDIFGKIKFKNEKEIVKAASKLETIFNQKGLKPEIIDSFLNKINIDPTDLRTTESVRQIGELTTRANQQGLNITELVQSVTKGIVTPKAVRDIAVVTGQTDEFVTNVIKPLIEKTAPTARGTLLETITSMISD